MKNLQKQEFGQSHEYWLNWVTKNSIRKNTVKKPPFDATKDVTEKDVVRNRYARMVAAAIYLEANRVKTLESRHRRNARWDYITTRVILAIGLALWLASAVYTITLIF